MSFPGRESQAKQISLLLDCHAPVIVAHGSEATGKSSVVSACLSQCSIPSAMVQCRECITGRHLFERVIAEISRITDDERQNGDSVRSTVNQKCENINAFATAVATLLAPEDQFVIALDGIDELRDAPPTLVPAIVRLSETIPALTVIFIVRYPTPRQLRADGVPHVFFPPYSREQSSAILSLHPPNLYPDNETISNSKDLDTAGEDAAWLYPRFCQAIWDSLAKGAANDLVSFRALCERLWPAFVRPIVNGTFRPRDFSRLITAQRNLLQDESCLQDSLIIESGSSTAVNVVHEFPYYTKWLLCAAYLSSYNPARMDAIYFMKATDRKKRKKGGGTAAGRQSKVRKIPRHLLSPASFSVDRLLAILHAILPHDFSSTIDIYTQITTLGSLRLLVRSGMYSSDALDRSGKWRANFGLDYVMKIARSLDFDITDYIAE